MPGEGRRCRTFKLTDLPDGPKVVVISETTANLTPHLDTRSPSRAWASPEGDVHTMKVTAVKMIPPRVPEEGT